jgi:hypothetical protein
MHWAPASVDPMLALRTVACADRWDEAWLRIAARLRADARDRSRKLQADRRATREAAQAAQPLTPSLPVTPPTTSTATPPPPTTKTIVDGRPTKAHPWNRRFLPHRPHTPAEN